MKNINSWFKEKLLFNNKKEENPALFVQKNAPHQKQAARFVPKNATKKQPFFEHKGGKESLKIIPLGGLEEVGKNMTVFETKNDIIIVDCGLQFPEEDMLGIDYVVPDVSYLEARRNKIRGVIITHGHLDHIGGLKHILPKIGNPPVYASRFTIGLIQKQLDEVSMTQQARLRMVESTETIRLGAFQVGFIKITHNVPGSFSIAIKTPFGTAVVTGDFKMDMTAPYPNDVPEFDKLARLGEKGVLLLLSDSTNATEEGYSRPEMTVGETMKDIIYKTKGRIIVATFASNVGRIQQLINAALDKDRKIFLSGRSMINNMAIAKKLGYAKYPDKAVSKISKIVNTLPDDKVLIITTGSQGEEFAALTRMASDKHAHVRIKKGDTIVMSSDPIPGTGNERAIYSLINKFVLRGANIITNEDLDVHASGHGKKEDLRLMLQLVKPKFFAPVHGEVYMREAHRLLAKEEGIEEKHTMMLTNGDILEFTNDHTPQIFSKKVDVHDVFVDGLGGTESQADRVLDERKTMSQNGMVIVVFKVSQKDRKLLGAPKVITRGFIYLEEFEEINQLVISQSKKIYMEAATVHRNSKQKDIRFTIQDRLGDFIEKKIGRNPLIVPVIIEM